MNIDFVFKRRNYSHFFQFNCLLIQTDGFGKNGIEK